MALAEAPDPDLRALEVAEHGNLAMLAFPVLAYQGSDLPVLLGTAMGEIDARHVHAGADQTLQHAWAAGDRAKGCDDLGLTEARRSLRNDEGSERCPASSLFEHGDGGKFPALQKLQECAASRGNV